MQLGFYTGGGVRGCAADIVSLVLRLAPVAWCITGESYTRRKLLQKWRQLHFHLLLGKRKNKKGMNHLTET